MEGWREVLRGQRGLLLGFGLLGILMGVGELEGKGFFGDGGWF